MANRERIQAHNTDLRSSIDKAKNLPDRGGEMPPTYDGDYTVTPSAEVAITLETSKKMLYSDITVNKIPYAEVSNNKGGKTVTIG